MAEIPEIRQCDELSHNLIKVTNFLVPKRSYEVTKPKFDVQSHLHNRKAQWFSEIAFSHETLGTHSSEMQGAELEYPVHQPHHWYPQKGPEIVPDYLNLTGSHPLTVNFQLTTWGHGPGSLEGMVNLSELWVRHSAGDPIHHAKLGKIIEAGKRVLQTSKAAGRKELHIQHIDPLDTIQEETLFILHGNLLAVAGILITSFIVVTLQNGCTDPVIVETTFEQRWINGASEIARSIQFIFPQAVEGYSTHELIELRMQNVKSSLAKCHPREPRRQARLEFMILIGLSVHIHVGETGLG
ncbi:hypothetical protein C8R44DRAFT_727212 [Mycena epipterygia]|nr:hypothetical protein C8R44DRAFT_727212 [Mycena epipterygia]